MNANNTPVARQSNCVSNDRKKETMASIQQTIEPKIKVLILKAAPDTKVLNAYKQSMIG